MSRFVRAAAAILLGCDSKLLTEDIGHVALTGKATSKRDVGLTLDYILKADSFVITSCPNDSLHSTDSDGKVHRRAILASIQRYSLLAEGRHDRGSRPQAQNLPLIQS